MIINIIFKTLFFYFVVLISYRIMGKREIGQLGIIDLIVSILIAELIAISIENINDSVIYTLIPIVLLVLLEIILAKISMKSRKFRSLFEGKPSLIIVNGKVNYKEMIKQRYSLDDLLLELRINSVRSIDEVEYAFLENNGKLSIFKYNIFKSKTPYPVGLIIDGEINEDTLKYINKDKNWLYNKLNQKNINLEDVFYCFCKSSKLYIIKK